MSSTSTTSPTPLPRAAQMAPISRSNRPTIVGPDQPESPYPLQLQGVVTKGFGRGARFLGIPTANLPDISLGPLNDLQLTGIYYGFARIHPSQTTPLPSAFPSRVGTPGPSHTSSSIENANKSYHPPAPKDIKTSPLSPEDLLALPPQTAPYPPDSVAGQEGIDKGRRLDEDDGKVWPMVMSVGWNPYFKNEKITAEVHIMHPFSHDFYGHDMSVLVLGYIRPELDYVSREALIDDIQFDVKVALNSLARPSYAAYASDPFLTGA